MLWSFIISLSLAESPTKLPFNHVRGKQLYDEMCFQCHGTLALAESQLGKSTNSPPLAGVILKENYAEAIKLIQAGKGMMPAYEMLLDKHDSKRILLYLSRLDPETGLDPNPEDYENAEAKEDEDTETNDIGTKTPNKNLPPKPFIPKLKENIEITPKTEEKK
jgi:mono/diheme cytochrome c family protein